MTTEISSPVRANGEGQVHKLTDVPLLVPLSSPHRLFGSFSTVLSPFSLNITLLQFIHLLRFQQTFASSSAFIHIQKGTSSLLVFSFVELQITSMKTSGFDYVPANFSGLSIKVPIGPCTSKCKCTSHLDARHFAGCLFLILPLHEAVTCNQGGGH